METFIYNDGGRGEAGFKGTAGDCVVRSIAIAAEVSYKTVYDELFRRNELFMNGRSRVAKIIKSKGASPRDGNFSDVYFDYIKSLGFEWVPCMKIGSGCKVHLKKEELPLGRIICRCSKHLVAVIDGIINDIFDPSREGTRCVYGYYIKK